MYFWRQKCYDLIPKPAECEYCKKKGETRLHYSRTVYDDNRLVDKYTNSRWLRLEVDLPEPSAKYGEIERKLDPNAPKFLCAPCAKDDDDFWNEQWKEYYSELGV